jgi:hypothetical protein
VILHRIEGQWQFAMATEGRHIVLASLMDRGLDDEQARSQVAQELAMTHGLRLSSWSPSRRPNAWSANLRPIAQAT